LLHFTCAAQDVDSAVPKLEQLGISRGQLRAICIALLSHGIRL
jgi:hypothetical protein